MWRCCRIWSMAAFNEAAKKVDEEAQRQDGRHARRHGFASRPVLNGGVCRAAGPAHHRNSNGCRVSARNPRSALPFIMLRTPREDAQNLRRRFSTSKTSSASARVATTLATASYVSIAATRTANRHKSAWSKSRTTSSPIETTRAFRGLYHVLHGAISPLRGIGPEQLHIKGLVDRSAQKPD